MKMANAARLALALLLFGFGLNSVWAGHAVLIWPVDPVMTSAEKAAELWVENKGASSTLLQVRVLSWRQMDGSDQYQTQQDVIASPPMLKLDTGKKQLIRLIRQTRTVVQGEQAYRILLDEVPTPNDREDDPANSLTFQMRYSIPLFIYGGQASPDKGDPQLSWRLVKARGEPYLEIANHGPVHARLSRTRLGKYLLNDGLFGYVLAHSRHRWPLKNPVPADVLLETRVDNRKRLWRGKAEVR